MKLIDFVMLKCCDRLARIFASSGLLTGLYIAVPPPQS